MEPSVSREVWRRLETVNAVTYFSPESRGASRALGMRGFWMGYFASRASPMGPVSAGVVEAVFYNFHPAMVRRAVPDAWRFASPEALLSARATAAADALRRLVPEVDVLAPRLQSLLTPVIERASGAGRPLFTANRDVDVGHDPVEGVWQAATTLREHRGDGHVAVLTEAGVAGCDAHVLYAATEGVAPEVLRDNRGWSDADWGEATERLSARGLLDGAGAATEAGRRLHRQVERRTDELAVEPYRVLGDDGLERVLAVSAQLADPVATSHEIPFPNPMGLPRPDPTS